MADLIKYMGKMYHPSALDSMRHNALRNQDSLAYAELSDLLGFSPDEDPCLYEMGLAERLEAESQKRPSAGSGNSKADLVVNIEKFLRAGSSMNLNDYNWGISHKAELLQMYFPKFAEGERQDITDYEPSEIGRLFKEIYNAYSAKAKKLEDKKNKNRQIKN